MTMTDTEAKALALVNEVQLERGWKPHLTLSRHDFSRTEALCRAIERHAAELREQAERFSEAVKRLPKHIQHNFRLAPFILHAPDPLVEVIADVRPWDTNHQWNNAAFSKRLAAAIEARGGKIVWEAGE